MPPGERGPASRAKKANDAEPLISNAMAKNLARDAQTVTWYARWSPIEAGAPIIKPPRIARRHTLESELAQPFISENTALERQYAVTVEEETPPTSQRSLQESTKSPEQVTEFEDLDGDASLGSSPSDPLKSTQDAFYLDRYCYILGHWFDIFDAEKHFSLAVPHLALSHPTLRLSVLAWAAKQYYLTHLTQTADISLSYYDRALRMLTTLLGDVTRSASPEIFASCLLLAVCEMMGDGYQDWQLHLEGTYSLITAHGWNGASGGLLEACFWIYCRMDVLSSLATASPCRLNPALWLPHENALGPQRGVALDSHGELGHSFSDGQPMALDCAVAVGRPRSSDHWTVNTWANRTVLLLAQVHDFLCKVRAEESSSRFTSLLDEWNKIREMVEIHEQNQPPQYRPLAVLEQQDDGNGNLFSSVRYVSEAVCLSIQILDVARLLFILARPERSRQDRVERFRFEAKRFMTHIRRVVANSIHNRHEINWVGAPQLLSVAGMGLSVWAERKALLRLLKDLHIQTGWNTRDNICGLLSWWGWAAPLNERGQSWEDVQQEIGPYASAGEWMLRMYDCGVIMKAARRGQSI